MNFNFTIIGAGKLAYSLISNLLKSGFRISLIISKKLKDAETLSEYYGLKNFSSSYEKISAGNDFIFICVPDDQIENTALMLSRLNLNFENTFFVHCSGAKNISLLKQIALKNGHAASLHFMQTFPDKKPVDFSGVAAAVECKDEDEDVLFELCLKLGLAPFRISSENKAGYHLMGVITANFQNVLFKCAAEIGREIKLSHKDITGILKPTVYSTLQNIELKGYAESLSGPVERGDISTIKNHVPVLQFNPSALLFYLSGNLLLLQIAKEKKSVQEKSYHEIKAYLSKEIRRLTLELD